MSDRYNRRGGQSGGGGGGIGNVIADATGRVGGPGGTPVSAKALVPFQSQLDVSKVQPATRNSSFLSITTYRGATNSLVEPSVEYVPAGWGSDTNGKAWRYWMCAGPYEGGNSAFENPSVWCSDDGLTWVIPPGATNPVIPGRSGDGNNCDPGLSFDSTGQLVLTWCVQNTTTSNDGVWYVTSPNGITWSTPTKVLAAPDVNATLSPRMIWDGKNWRLWVLNFTASHIEQRTASTIAGLSSASVTNSTGLTPPGNDTSLWEFEVKWCAGEWWMLLNGRFGNGNLALATSVDGNAWTQSGTVLGGTNNTADWDYQVYKSAFVPVFDGDRVLIRLWYNGWANTVAVGMHVGYTTTYVAGSAALTGTAGGDLSGTYPNPTVAKVNGVAVTGAASTGLVLTATGASAATWQAGGGGGGTSGTTPFQAATLGMLSMNVDPSLAQSNLSLTAGVLYLMKVPWLATATVTNIHAYVAVVGATLTANQNLAGIYDSSGTRLAVTVDQSTAWTSTGVKTMALTAPLSVTGSAPGGYVYVALLFNGTTTPQFLRAPNGSIYIGTVSAARHATQLTAQTSLPASLTLSSNTAQGNFPWIGLS